MEKYQLGIIEISMMEYCVGFRALELMFSVQLVVIGLKKLHHSALNSFTCA